MSRQPGNRADNGAGVSQSAVSDSQQDVIMRYGAAVQPLRVNTRLAPEGQFNGLQPRTEYTRDLPPLQERRQVATYHAVSRQREHFQDDHEWQDVEYDAESEEDGEQENADPSTESSGNSREAQHWSDTSSARTGELDDESQGEVSCRVSWCEQPGKRYGLCWAHGGVKKCCHGNCPKIALPTGEFCSTHEREISGNT
ncbi:hypothetical protein L917_13973 [Phytophthora nicotianae]|uniref:Uncharacterized protein n=3 Tax=Phytophthora nicotianae TaxID=4792 RepID=V9EKP4_PHYNI|nr:hypothetical protein F443_14651 [Phytophthora nicotianae P1569]ETI39794.1 hypothetical protein F443_14647 [Phytophthora nicotianae P1569]ETL86637.1 hypothetical protein L917_13973 [Phytophthora nicotianae]ETM39780.1 hypothetical protein L914_14098 [Phytophthora nicotianae]ETO68534.1 hypothetical protein F444_14656 [Phytophthora nicotianae P1976]